MDRFQTSFCNHPVIRQHGRDNLWRSLLRPSGTRCQDQAYQHDNSKQFVVHDLLTSANFLPQAYILQVEIRLVGGRSLPLVKWIGFFGGGDPEAEEEARLREPRMRSGGDRQQPPGYTGS